MLDQVANWYKIEDTEEMVQWRSIRQEGFHDLWKKPRGKMEEEVLEKKKVEEAKKDAYKGRGEPPTGGVPKKKRCIHFAKMERRLLGHNFL